MWRVARGAVSLKPLIVRRRPVERRDGDIVEPQVDRQLPSMMGEMVEGAVADRDIPRLLGDDVAAGEQLPGGHQVFVGSGTEGRPRLVHGLVEYMEELAVSGHASRLMLAGRGDVELILSDHRRGPARDRGDERRQVPEG